MLERMYKEYPKGAAPSAMQVLADKIRAADGFVFVTGEYNWGVQPGLKNLTDHYLEEWFWRPRRDRQLFLWPDRGRALKPGMAGNIVGDGHGDQRLHPDHRPPSPRRWTRWAARPAAAERRWSAPSRASPTTSSGGSRRRKLSGL